MTNKAERAEKIAQTVAHIRKLVGERDVVTYDILAKIKGELVTLAKREHLFALDDFPYPDAQDSHRSYLYRLSEDDDHRFALYVHVTNKGVDAPPHDHTTWAVIVGVLGNEENRFYKKVPTGVDVTGGDIVRNGHGVTLLPDDVHSIHTEAGEVVLNFHMYGLALEQLSERKYWSDAKKDWSVFPAHSGIIEARG